MDIQIHCKNRAILWLGLFTILTSLLVPSILTAGAFGIMDDLLDAIRLDDSILMLYGALKLVLLNILRSLPNYLGVFILAEVISFQRDGKELKLVKYLIMFCTVSTIYVLVDRLFCVRYDFGLPAVTLILLIIFFSNVGFTLVNLPKKLVMVSMFIIGVQFTDIMPALSDLPIGHGSLSQEVKLTAAFLNRERELQIIAVLFCVLFLLMGLLVMLMVRDENHLRERDALVKINQQIRIESQMQELENRTHVEIQHLVHDLKSPLTSGQALVTLAQYACQQKGEEQIASYLDGAVSSLDTMDHMISEILSEHHRSTLTTQALLDATLAQISVSPYASMVQTHNSVPALYVSVNKVRFIRVLINLVQNSAQAVDPVKGRIRLSVDQDREGQLLFSVEDNGCGIAQSELQDIWENGVSRCGSHGLGLGFVKKVVTDMGGTVQVSSTPGTGTTFTIRIQEGACSNEP